MSSMPAACLLLAYSSQLCPVSSVQSTVWPHAARCLLW